MRNALSALRVAGVTWWPPVALVSAGVACGASGCGPSGGDPLGGPHGGTIDAPAPGPENLESPASDGAAGSPDAGPLDDSGVVATDAAGADGETAGGPTWTAIFNSYLAACKTCHNEMGTAGSSYTWLRTQGYIAGTSSPLVSAAQSCLTWYGGDMPPGGGSNAAAVTEMNAWAAAGALYN